MITNDRTDEEWPTDMVIYLEHLDWTLLPLLFAHGQLHLPTRSTVPRALSPGPARPLESLPDAEGAPQLAAEWDTHWATRLEELATQRHPDDLAKVPNLHQLLWRKRASLVRWRDVHDDTFDDNAYEAWLAAVDAANDSTIPDELTPSLVTAWTNGLFTITILPLRDDFALRLSAGCLLVSRSTWGSPELMRESMVI